MIYIKCTKGGVNVEVQNANAIPPNTADYTYSEVTEAEYSAILQEFAERDAENAT